MILLAHIFIALSGIGVATFIVFKPSARLLKVTYCLTAATLLTGTYLVVSTGSHILQSCMTGLAYLGVVSVGIVIARTRLAAATKNNN